MSSKAIDQDIEQSIKTQWNAYRISALIATLMFLVSACISMVPGMYPKDQLLLIGSAAIVVMASLTVGLWRGRTKKAPIANWPFNPLIGIVLLFELGECLFGIFKVLPLVFR